MDGDTKREPLITLKFPDKDYEFLDLDALDQFKQTQYEEWEWIMQLSQYAEALHNIRAHFANYISEIQEFSFEYKRHQGNKGKQDELKNKLHMETQVAISKGFLHSESPKAKFINSVKTKTTLKIAVYTWAILTRQDIDFRKDSIDSPAVLESTYWAFQHMQDSDTVEALKATKRSWDIKFGEQYKELQERNDKLISTTSASNKELREHNNKLIAEISNSNKELQERNDKLISTTSASNKELREHNNKLITEISNSNKKLQERKDKLIAETSASNKKLQERNDKLIAEISNSNKKLQERNDKLFEKQLQTQNTKFNAQFTEAEKKLNDITQTYDDKLALQSSVKYWGDKRKHHQKMVWCLGIATVVLALVAGGVFISEAHSLLGETEGEPTTQALLQRLAIMLTISSLGVWATRLSAKIFISNLHLRTDADERVTMIQTYLALLREGSGPKENERQLILQTLFRPGATGFIKEDAHAGFFENILSRTIKKSE